MARGSPRRARAASASPPGSDSLTSPRGREPFGGSPPLRSMDSPITIVGGGLAGLIASIACAEAGAEVHLVEAHAAVGGRAVTAEGPWKANLGPHALYTNTGLYQWLQDRKSTRLNS